MTGVEVVESYNVGSGHGFGVPDGIECIMPGGMGQVASGKSAKPLYERLLETAKRYLRDAGIKMPYVTLEVTQGLEVIMHGVPNSGPILVCAQTEAGIQNYI